MRAKPRAKDPWEARFETLLEDDGYAQRIFARLLSKGVRQRRLALLLEAATDPNIESRLQRSIEDGWIRGKGRSVQVHLFPSKRNAKHLAHSLRDTAADIRCFWLRSLFAFLPYRKTALDIASSLDQQARALDEVKWSVITKRIGYKTLWRQVPLALLCLELQAPDQISYAELSQLLGVALRAHDRPDTDSSFGPDAIRRRYERFCKRQGGRGALDLLEAFLKMILPSD